MVPVWSIAQLMPCRGAVEGVPSCGAYSLKCLLDRWVFHNTLLSGRWVELFVGLVSAPQGKQRLRK